MYISQATSWEKTQKEAEELAKKMRENSQGILYCIEKQFVDNDE